MHVEVATPGIATEPAAAAVSAAHEGIVLPPLVRGGASGRAPSRRPLRATPRPITPRPFAARAPAPTPRPPRFNLPRLLGRPGRPSQPGVPPPLPTAPSAPRVSPRAPSGPLPTRSQQPPSIEELDDGWGDLDALMVDDTP
ncbi:MAG: hypothetical protein R3A79_20425 [Nannocystaceae bacterium]